MKRKLVYKDLSEVRKLCEKLELTGRVLTFDLEDGEVFSHDTAGDAGEEEAQETFLSGEEAVAELARQADLPAPTALRYIQNSPAYFETDKNEIALTPYNIKLLQLLDKIYTQGYTAPQVIRELREGNLAIRSPIPVSLGGENAHLSAGTPAVSPLDQAQKYFSTASYTDIFPDEKESNKPGRFHKFLKWGLVALAPLLLLAVYFGYQLGYLGTWEAPTASPEPPRPGPAAPPEPEPQQPEDTRWGTPVLPGGEGQIPEAPEAEDPDAEEEANAEPADSPVVVLPPDEVTVDVLNGCGIRGAAGRFAEKLRQEGYRVREVRDAQSFDYVRSQIISRTEEDGTGPIRELLPGAELLTEEPGENRPMVTVIVGSDDAN